VSFVLCSQCVCITTCSAKHAGSACVRKLPVLQCREEVSALLGSLPASRPALLTATCCLPHSTVCRRHHMQARLRRRLLNSWSGSRGPV
jgi:hypothetical protein